MVLLAADQAIHDLIWHPCRLRLALPIDSDMNYVNDNSGKNMASVMIFDGLFELQSQFRKFDSLGADA